MDAFEHIVRGILNREGYWTRVGYKVELTKNEKVSIGRPSTPRWEIDILAYKPSSNELLVVECKSYLDSTGVAYESISDSNSRSAKRFKLFTEPMTRTVVLERLKQQLIANQMILPQTRVSLGLAVGKFRSQKDSTLLRALFDKRGWVLFSDEWISEKLNSAAKSGYENDSAIIAAKIIARGQRM